MRTLSFSALASLLLVACPATPEDSGKDGPDDTDTGEIDSGDTDETGETGEVAAVLTGIEVAASATDITTRDTLAVAVTGTYDDGSTADLTASATFASSDESVLKFYEAGIGQPIWSGTVTVTATVEGYSGGGDVNVTLAAVQAGDLVFNEVLADGTVDGDPNGDGTLDDMQDEFVEIANLSNVTVDISGATLVETDFEYLPRHTFAEGTILRAGECVVVFGAGSVDALASDHATYVVAVNEDPALEYGLSLANAGELMNLVAADGTTVIASIAYGDAGSVEAVDDASMVLDPDVWGTEYTSHHYATGATTDFSPGTLIDGTAFGGPDWAYNR